ncbi:MULTISPECIES: hypothetical protein [Chryseobacterium]|uniref:YhhN-like protein n=1 Tax=Chryseobacterium geocarposphaerae TaxID=1416776 RepID=A0ABU1LD89_9FLAO|nr:MULTISPECIES: hypothetical protein [Chryseobacterium]MDR6404664.1 hypothetical protein [Chryseobacterium geocarposphaerae]MDR6698103.1 hypothetical protein [Chryseobacterium ginsenosidimutans]
MEDAFKVILYFNNGFLFISALIGLLKFKRLKDIEKWYVYYIIFLFFIEAAIKISIYVLKLKSIDFLYPLYVSGELLLLGSLFIRKSNPSKYWYIPIFILVGYFFFVNKIETNEFKKVFSNIVVISFTGYSLLMEIRKNETNKDRFILVDAFIFLYYAVSVFIFFMLKQLKTFSNDEVYMIWSMNNILCSFLYLSIIYTFLKLKK